ncbi:MAG: TRAP transporter substrate-binding protein DctP [Trueperaceae bacterium]|nr:TRAP transporter substrate-binding protein DctP [Trueperaceae bacterium]
MKRRDFLKRAGATVAASAAFSPLMFANAQRSTYRFAMVTSWPTSLDTIYGGATNTALYLNEITDGDVEVETFPAGAQVGGLEVYDAVSSGAFEMGHTASYYYVGKNPAHGFFTSVPFGLNAQQMDAWMTSGGGQALFNEINEPDNMIAFPAGNTGVQMGGWFNKEINTPDDLNGLTMRIPGLGGQVMSRAGANVQVIPGGEIFLALERGVIDATEWVGPYDDEILGLNQAAQYYYAPGWHEPGPTLSTYINLDVFNDLPADIQAAVETASARANQKMLADYDAKNGPAYARLLEAGAEPRIFPTEVLATLEGYMDEIHAENAAADDFYARVYESFLQFRADVLGFHRISEYAFLDYLYTSGEER